MPAKSVAQQRLMGQAYALKKGDIELKDLDPEYRDEIKALADGMTTKQLKDFAETKHKGLPNKVKENMSHIKTFESYLEEAYIGNKSDFDYEFGLALDRMGISGKAIKKISKIGKKFEVRMSSYMSQKSTWEKIGDEIGATLVDFKPGSINIGVYESKVNEDYIELPNIMVPAKKLAEAYSKWYKDTSKNWEDYKDEMAEDSVDEAARNAQMEILAYLSNKMNDVIKDNKMKVNMDLK